MENENKMIFVEGMNFKPRPENAPETFRGGIYFKYPDFARFMEQHRNEKGWLNVKMMKSKEKGTIYFILDTWKPKTESVETKEYNNNKYKTLEEIPTKGQTSVDEETGEVINLEDIPF